MSQGTQPGLCDNLEGWDGVGGGREVQEFQEGGDICLPIYHWFMLMYGRNQHNQLKMNKLKNNPKYLYSILGAQNSRLKTPSAGSLQV